MSGEGSSRVLVRFGTGTRPQGSALLACCASSGYFASIENGPPREGDLVVDIGGTPPERARCVVRVRGAEISWSPGYASLRCTQEVADALLPGLAHFAQVEAELRRLEEEVSSAWGDLEEDRPIAFEAKPADLRRSPVLAARVSAAFSRRIRFARLESCMLTANSELTPAAAELADDLGEAADLESRFEVLDGQLEVFEHIYEMASQRLGEFRASHQGNKVEWLIVALLAAEIVLMLLAGWGRGAPH